MVIKILSNGLLFFIIFMLARVIVIKILTKIMENKLTEKK